MEDLNTVENPTEPTVEPTAPVVTTDPTEKKPEAQEKTAEELAADKSEESRKAHQENSQKLHQETMARLKVDAPSLYEDYTGKKVEPATKSQAENLVSEETDSIMDMSRAEFAKFQSDITYKTVENINTKRELRSELSNVHRAVTEHAEKVGATENEIKAALAKAERIVPKHKRTDPGDFSRWGELVVDSLTESSNKRFNEGTLNTAKAEEEARVEKVNALQHPSKSSTPATTVEKTEEQEHLEKMQAVGPKSSRELFDKNRK